MKKPALLLMCIVSLFSTAQAQFEYVQFMLDGGQAPWYLAHVADVDGDGDKDLVTQHADNTIYLSRNDGQASFAPGELMKANHIFFGMVDLDWPDGDGDLIARDLSLSNLVRVYHNDGLGIYDRWETNFSDDVTHFYHGDMDGDGDRDFLFNAGAGFARSIYCCEAFPVFPQPPCVQIANIAFPFSLCGGYFDADGMADFFISYNLNSDFRFFRNFGLGHFDFFDVSAGFPAMGYTLPKGVGCADVDGNGTEDAYFWSVELRRIVWRSNDGNANFGPILTIADDTNLCQTSLEIRAADCDNDGDTDFLVLGDERLYLFHNNGPAGFSGEILLDDPTIDHAFLEDLDGDGFRDVVIGRPNDVIWFKNLGNCQFDGPRFAKKLLQLTSESASVGDLNGDQKPDLLLAAPDDDILAWFENKGSGRFGGLLPIAAAVEKPLDAFPADLDSDQLTDVLAIAGNAAVPGFFKNLGSGNFNAFAPLLPASPDLSGRRIHASDADGDSDPDVFVSGNWMGNAAILLLKNEGAGQFSQPEILANIAPDGFCLREHPDLDGDGRPDLLLVQDATVGGIFWQKNLGNGNFDQPKAVDTVFAWLNLRAADLNGDMLPDLVASGSDGSICWFENSQAGQLFLKKNILPASPNRYCIAATDFDGDGDADLFVSHRPGSIGRIAIFENNGAGNFQVSFDFEGQTDGHTLTEATDMDRDGDEDIVFCGPTQAGWYANRRIKSQIRGFCFLDSNENGLYDPGEMPLLDVAMRLLPLNLLTYTQPDGTFGFQVPEGDYVVEIESLGCWVLTSDSTQFHVKHTSGLTSGGTFGFKSGSSALSAQPLVASNTLQCDLVESMSFSVSNTCCQPISGRLLVVGDSIAMFESADIAPSGVDGDSLWWDFNGLAPAQTLSILAQMAIPNVGIFGAVSVHNASVFLENTDGSFVPSGTYRSYTDVYCEAFFDNYKRVDKTFLFQNYTPEEGELTYIFRFQNETADTVRDLRIYDRLDTAFLWHTFRSLGSSHLHSATINLGTGEAEFYFPDIFLPDSMTNQAGSVGWAAFSVKLKPGRLPGTTILNDAIYYFDEKSALQTTQTGTSIFETVVNATELASSSRWSLYIYPNPNTSIFTVELPEPANRDVVFRIIDLTGRLVQERNTETGTKRQTIQTGGLPNGLYFLQVLSEGKVLAIEKFVKQ